MRARSCENWFAIEKLTDAVYGIGEFGHFEEVISYLLIGKDTSVLIDTGMGFYSIRQAIDPLIQGPCNVVNTHSHFDHIGSNHEFQNVFLFDHELNRRHAVQGIQADQIARWFKDDQFWEMRPKNLPECYEILPFPQAEFFSDNETLVFGSLELSVIYTPGHSDDSVCFYQPEQGFLYAGDLLYDGPIYIEKEGGLKKYRNSISRVSSLPGLKRIFPAHNSYNFGLDMLERLCNTLASLNSVELEEEVIIRDRFRLVPE